MSSVSLSLATNTDLSSTPFDVRSWMVPIGLLAWILISNVWLAGFGASENILFISFGSSEILVIKDLQLKFDIIQILPNIFYPV